MWLDFDLPLDRNICAELSINIPDVGLHLSILRDDDLIMKRQNRTRDRGDGHFSILFGKSNIIYYVHTRREGLLVTLTGNFNKLLSRMFFFLFLSSSTDFIIRIF